MPIWVRAVSINSIFEQVLTEQGLVRQFREEGRISIPTTSHNEGHKSIYSSPFMKELQGLPSFPPAARASAEITMHDKDAGRALPPTLIVHGLRDRTVPCKNSQTLAATILHHLFLRASVTPQFMARKMKFF